jgi:formylmethanofuran dehydrogenase subunit E
MESKLIIFEKYLDGLKDIENCEFLQVLFKFHLCRNDYNLIDHSYNGRPTGIFASRSNGRPNNIGLTTVQQIGRYGNRIKVVGLDALNRSPILDIKPYNPILDKKWRPQESYVSNSF